MNRLYQLVLDHPADVSSAGDRIRNLALRTGFSDMQATAFGVLVRELATMLEQGSHIWIGLRTGPPPSRLTVAFDGYRKAPRAESLAAEWADSVLRDDNSLELSFVLPDPEFKPDPAWLRETQIWLAKNTLAELEYELIRTNEELRIALEHVRRQARHEAKKASTLQNANVELEQMHAKEFRLARVDPVSHLPSRVQFEQSLAEQIEQSHRKNRQFALLYIDLDFFKEINDSFGHAAGDQTLMTIGQRMKATLRDSDLVGRLGGDEFGVILQQLGQPSDAGKVASLLIAAIRDPIALDCGTGHVGGSVGIAVFPDHGQDARTLMKNADTAMYAVKRRGRGNFAFYSAPSDDIDSQCEASPGDERSARDI